MNDGLVIFCDPNVAKTIKTISTAALPLETGGLLLGWWEAGCIVIKHAIEVVDPNATRSAWSRHQDAAQRSLDETLQRYNHPWLGFIGDWHSHTTSCPPSNTDLHTIIHSSRQFAQPLALLVHSPPDEFDVRAAHAGRLKTSNMHMSTSEQQDSEVVNMAEVHPCRDEPADC